MRAKWLTLFLALAVGIAGSGFAAEGDSVETWDYAPDEATICGAESVECRKVSCMDECLATGEDPMECPAYCILEAKTAAPRTFRISRK
jgi:hypothetical protein